MSETVTAPVVETAAAPVEAAPLTSMVDTAATEAPVVEAPAETEEAKATRETAEAEARTAEHVKALEAVTLPDGMNAADTPAFAEFKAIAAKHGLSQDAAQALVDAIAPKFAAAITDPLKAWATTQEAWIGEIKADKEVGDLVQAAGIARRGIDALMGADAAKVREALAFTGAGNNPAVFRMLMRVGKMMGEANPVASRGAAGPTKIGAAAMYPTLAGADA